MLSLPLLQFVLTAIRRDRIVQLMLVLIALGTAGSWFMGSAAVIEEQAFAIAAVGTVLRLMAVLGLVVFISFFMRRSFDTREIDYLLATPLTRFKLLFSLAVAFSILAIFLALVIAGVMALMAQTISLGWIWWSASVLVELIITAMIALFFATVLRSATVATLCSFGYYSLARMMGLMIGILETKIEYTNVLYVGVNWIVKAISVVTPRFDLMAQSSWVIYGQAEGLPFWMLPVQLVVFCFLFFVCANFDLKRVQF
jgi:hypothetical protein